VVAAGVALVAALGGYVMVKFFGVIFLGQPREPRLASSHDAAVWERAGLLWLAAGCLALGLLPTLVIALIDPVTRVLVGDGIGPQVAANGWLLLAPVSRARASYSPLLFLALVAASFAVTFVLVRRLYHGRLRRAAPWDCGFPLLNARMQDTAEGFGQRSARCSSRSSASTATCRARSTAGPPTAWRRATTCGTGCTCRGARQRRRLAAGRQAAAGPHLDLPDVQLRHAAGDAAAGVPMSAARLPAARPAEDAR